MKTEEKLLRQLIRETLFVSLNEDNMKVVGGGEAGTTKKVGKETAEDLKGFLDINKLSSELKVPADKLRMALKDADKGKRKINNDKVFADTMLKILSKPKKDKEKVMNVIKKVEFSPEKQLDNIMKKAEKESKKPEDVKVAM